MNGSSGIETHGYAGQTSEQLAERNAIKRWGCYAVLGCIAFGVMAKQVAPGWSVQLGVLGFFLGTALAVTITRKRNRDEIAQWARAMQEQAEKQECDLQAKIRLAEANGDFDRWKADT